VKKEEDVGMSNEEDVAVKSEDSAAWGSGSSRAQRARVRDLTAGGPTPAATLELGRDLGVHGIPGGLHFPLSPEESDCHDDWLRYRAWYATAYGHLLQAGYTHAAIHRSLYGCEKNIARAVQVLADDCRARGIPPRGF
jgi:hypothetical protein